MRLIDANKIYDAVERRYQVSSGIEHRCERDLLELICLSETVDAAPVKHGKWIEKEDMIGSYLEQSNVAFYECSVCKETSGEISSYCPNCGAKMDGGDDNAAD